MNSRSPKSIDREKIEAEIRYMDEDEFDEYTQDLDPNTLSADDNAWFAQTFGLMVERYEEQVRRLSRVLSIRKSAKSDDLVD